jgi:hypothetical protein
VWRQGGTADGNRVEGDRMGLTAAEKVTALRSQVKELKAKLRRAMKTLHVEVPKLDARITALEASTTRRKK